MFYFNKHCFNAYFHKNCKNYFNLQREASEAQEAFMIRKN